MRHTLCTLPLLALAVACAPDATAPVHQIEESRLFWALTLDHHAVTLSLAPPYDTLTLAATPRTVSGAELDGVPAPHFRSTDIDRVWVDSTGLLHARNVANNVVIVATDTVNDIVHADTAWVNVTDVTEPPTLAVLSIHPVPPDTAKFALTNLFLRSPAPPPLTARVLDFDGNAIDGSAVYFTSLNPAVATVDPTTGAVKPQQVGDVTFIGSATVYGIMKSDTLSYTIGLPLLVEVTPQPHVDDSGDTVMVFPPSVIVGVGGEVLWHNATTIPVDVTFDDPTNVAHDELFCGAFAGSPYEEGFCNDGNIRSWTADSSEDQLLNVRLRQFHVPGTYNYRSTLYGTTGTIIVR